MFFTSSTIQTLKKDHKLIRNTIEILVDPSCSAQEKQGAFQTLVPTLLAHSQSEESVIYTFIKASYNGTLRAAGFEGTEEHAIVHQLLTSLESDLRLQIVPEEQWVSKAKILGELIEHHIYKEEKIIFPKLKMELDEGSDEQLCREYQKLMSAAFLEVVA